MIDLRGQPCMRTNQATRNIFSVEMEHSGGVTFVRCHGVLVIRTNHLLYREVEPLLLETKRIVLDLKELTNLDSMGIGTLMRLYVAAKAAKCSLQLMNVGGRVHQVLGITNVLSVFETVAVH